MGTAWWVIAAVGAAIVIFVMGQMYGQKIEQEAIAAMLREYEEGKLAALHVLLNLRERIKHLL